MAKREDVTIGCIGCGTMGGAIVSALAKAYDPKKIYVTAKHPEKAQAFARSYGVQALDSNRELVQRSRYVFIAVKPAFCEEVLAEIWPVLTAEKVLISLMAGVTLQTLKTQSASDAHLLRIMPNLPAVYGESMTALCASDSATEEDVAAVTRMLECTGKVECVPERLMDGITAVSGSGPAYAFLFIEALADAAVKFGLPRQQAIVYAAQTLKGAAVMALEDGRSLSELKDAVCSPAGTTIEGVAALEQQGFRGAVIQAATAAYLRSVELGRPLEKH